MKQAGVSTQSLTELLASGVVVVTTSVELASADKTQVEATIKARSNTGTVVYRIDPDVLGGVRIQSADWYVDTTLKQQLTALAATLKA